MTLLAKYLHRYLELTLTLIGLSISIILILTISGDWPRKWMVIAAVATVVAVFHGLIFFVFRFRRRALRRRVLREIRDMLKDRINNTLTVATLALPSSEATSQERASESLQEVSELIDSLSEESLESWKRQYPSHARFLAGDHTSA